MLVARHPQPVAVTVAATSRDWWLSHPGRLHARSLHTRCSIHAASGAPGFSALAQHLGTCSSRHWQQQCSTQPWCQAGLHQQTTHSHHRRTSWQKCASSAAEGAGMQPAREVEPWRQQQQQQQQQQVGSPTVQGNTSSAANLTRQYASVVMPSLQQQQQLRAHRLLAWLPPPLLLHLQSLLGFLHACWELLPQFISPGFREALRRLVLVLGASLLMIVVVSTIDSAWLYLYLLNARQIATAA